MTIIVTAAVIVASFSLFGRPAVAPTEFVVVQPRDTVASIVARYLPDWDAADAIAEIESLNGVAGGPLPVGTMLRIPAQP